MLRYDRQTKPGLILLYDIGQEMERVYSYNPGARTGHFSGVSFRCPSDTVNTRELRFSAWKYNTALTTKPPRLLMITVKYIYERIFVKLSILIS